MNFKSLSLLAAAGLCTLSLCGSVSAAELRVATNPTFPPFEFQDSNTGTIQGFEMDLVAEIAKKLGDTVKIDKITFDGIIPAILSGSVDLGASGFSVTPERGKKVLFSLPFYKSGLTILVLKPALRTSKASRASAFLFSSAQLQCSLQRRFLTLKSRPSIMWATPFST